MNSPVKTPTLPAASVETEFQPILPGDPLYPSVEHIQIDDGKPVDNIYSEVQLRLLVEPLYSSWKPGRDFVAKSDVGVFHTPNDPPIVPDVLLSMDIKQPQDLRIKEHLSYFVWLRGKVPDIVIAVVSQYAGGEDTHKLDRYSRLRVGHYVIWDPIGTLKNAPLRYFRLDGLTLVQRDLPPILDGVGLGLTTWNGAYESNEETWLRWTDESGQLIQTGAELAQQASHRAREATTQAERELVRANQESQRANDETIRANIESKRANDETIRANIEAQRSAKLEQLLKQHGIELPD